jgi:hypothetical protein
MMGGRASRRRKGSKKTRKMRGGVMYGPTQAITPGALQWGAVDTSAPYDSATGAKMNDPFGTSPYTNAKVTGAGRRRTRKGKGKKSRKTKRSRKMRGGMFPGSVNSAPVGTGFVGGIPGFPTGSQTYGAYSGYPQKVPAGEPYKTGPDGVKQLPV